MNNQTQLTTPRIPYQRAGTFEYTWQEAKQQLEQQLRNKYENQTPK